MMMNNPKRTGNHDSDISISMHLDDRIIVSVNNCFVSQDSSIESFFIRIVEKKKNSDELLPGGHTQ